MKRKQRLLWSASANRANTNLERESTHYDGERDALDPNVYELGLCAWFYKF